MRNSSEKLITKLTEPEFQIVAYSVATIYSDYMFFVYKATTGKLFLLLLGVAFVLTNIKSIPESLGRMKTYYLVICVLFFLNLAFIQFFHLGDATANSRFLGSGLLFIMAINVRNIARLIRYLFYSIVPLFALIGFAVIVHGDCLDGSRFGCIEHPNTVAQYALVIASCAVLVRKIKFSAMISSVVVMSILLLATGSRTNLLAAFWLILTAIVIGRFRAGNHSPFRLLAIITGGPIVVAILAGFSQMEAISRVANLSEIATLNNRIFIWKAYWNRIFLEPFVGTGWENLRIQVLFPDGHGGLWRWTANQTHNLLLTEAVTQGFPNVILLILLFVPVYLIGIFRPFLSRQTTSSQWSIAMLLSCCATISIMNAVTNSYNMSPWKFAGVLNWLCVGLVCVSSSKNWEIERE